MSTGCGYVGTNETLGCFAGSTNADALIAALQGATSLTVSDITEVGAALASAFGNRPTVPGIIISQNTLFALQQLLAGDPGTEAGRNEQNKYLSVFFPTLSHSDQFLSYSFDPDALITFTKIADLPPEISYLDINIYYRGMFSSNGLPPSASTLLPTPLGATSTEWNGSISETVSAYQYGVTGIESIVFGCNKVLVGTASLNTQIVRTCPIEYTQRLNQGTTQIRPHAILFRIVQTDGTDPINLNKYYRMKYIRPRRALVGPYYNIPDDGISQYYINPLRTTYPINAAARAAFEAYVAEFAANPNLTQLPVFPYFANRATVFSGAIDTAYRALVNNVDIFFDNRSCVYYTLDYTPVAAGSTLYVIEYNQKLEAGRCQYASISFYNGADDSLLESFLTIPPDTVPTSPYLLVQYTNNTGDVLSIGVGERIYQYPGGEYSNTENMAVFVLPFNPSTLV